jgi:putative spermidine/putrescine transport system ATP-binding protein
LRIRRRSKQDIRRRVEELLDTVHLRDAEDKYPHELSGGMQQRVALARALAIAPPLLLLDEPLSALDAAIRDSLRTELRRLQRQLNVTVIYVTHDQAEAMALSDTIVVMEMGKVSQVGSPRDLYDRPTTRFTASFVGASNRRETTVEQRNGRPVIRWGRSVLPIDLAGGPMPTQPVIASWRPESARIGKPSPAADQGLTGSIELITFLGPITRLDIRLDGDIEPVIVDLPSSDAQTFVPGRAVSVTVPPEAIRLYQ